jgi:hypothetical protein
MSTQRIHMPTAILTHNGSLIIAAAKNHAEIATRLSTAYIAAADTLCQKVGADVSTQKTAKGELGNLTTAQRQNLATLHSYMAQAAKTAKLAFPGQTVKLHQEFQTGAHDANDLGSYLGRVDIVLASVKNAANLAVFKLKGWTDADTAVFQTARDAFGPAEQVRTQSIGGAKDMTTTKNADAATLYQDLLTIQNAADLQFPASDPMNAGVRGEFLLGIFPPDHGGNSTPAPTPAPAPAPSNTTS